MKISSEKVLISIISGKRPDKMRVTEKFTKDSKFEVKIFSNDSEGYNSPHEIINVPQDYRDFYQKNFAVDFFGMYAPMNRSYSDYWANKNGYKYNVQLDDNISGMSIKLNDISCNFGCTFERFSDVFDIFVDVLVTTLENSNAKKSGFDMQTPNDKLFLSDRFSYSFFCTDTDFAIPYTGSTEDDINNCFHNRDQGYPVVQVSSFRYDKVREIQAKDSTGSRAAYQKLGNLRGELSKINYGAMYSKGLSNVASFGKNQGDDYIIFKHKIKALTKQTPIFSDSYTDKILKLTYDAINIWKEHKESLAMESKSKNYLVVGAGLYGSIFAAEVAKKGHKVTVIDKRAKVGGNVSTTRINGINVHDYGAHIFHTNNEKVWKYITKLVPFNDYTNTVIANHDGTYYNLPFNLNTFEQMWGISDIDEIKEKIEAQIKAANIPDKPQNLEQQAISMVGTDIYETLIKGYTEKQWGKPCNELPTFIIKRIPLRFERDNNYFNDKFQGVPKNGYQEIFEKLLKHRNINVRFVTDYFSLPTEEIEKYDKVVFTGELDKYFNYKYGNLDWRSLRFENEQYLTNDFQKHAVINFTSSKVPFTRKMEWKHFDGKGKENFTILTREYPQEYTGENEPYYPINDKQNEARAQKYREECKLLDNVIFGGRLAEYKYYNMDEVIHRVLTEVEREIKQ